MALEIEELREACFGFKLVFSCAALSVNPGSFFLSTRTD